ncbi:MAG: matrixin family metalloprotease [Verrucomicrobiales bacterium]|nr:matrixin family metalloprotease [Verrucomicrobiales bacterium]
MKRAPSLVPLFLLFCLLSPAGAIEIVIDYTYDTNNFFNTQAKRDALQAVADRYSEIIEGNLAAVEPSGTMSGTSPGWRIGFKHPGTGDSIDLSTAANAGTDPLNSSGENPAEVYGFPGLSADQWILFAGGRPQASAGSGGTGTGTNFTTTFDDVHGPMHRGFNDNTPGANSVFDLPRWGGSISFNTGETWHFDLTTAAPFGSVDFYSIALHEIGHALGLSTAFNQFPTDGAGKYTGADGIAAFNGDNGSSVSFLSLQSAGNRHFADDVHKSFVFSAGTPVSVGVVPTGTRQDLVMDPVAFFSGQQQRLELTNVDVAALRDLGWETLDAPDVPDFSRPDNRTGRNLLSSVGNNIYQTLSGQQFQLRSKRARKVRAVLGVQNDGNIDDSFAVFGTKGNRTFRIRYTAGGANVTSAMIRGNHNTGLLTPNSIHQVSILVKPKKKRIKKVIRRPGLKIIKYRKKTRSFLLRAISDNDAGAIDFNRLRVRT